MGILGISRIGDYGKGVRERRIIGMGKGGAGVNDKGAGKRGESWEDGGRRNGERERKPPLRRNAEAP